MFKCVVCGKDAEYIYFGMSLCGEHFRGFPKPSVSQSASPQFNLEEELTRHEWKGHRLPDGSYARGSLDWGWDYKDNFSPEAINALEKEGPLQIGDYEFTLTDRIVQVRRKK